MLRRLGRPLTNIICSDRAVLTQSINAKSPTSKLPTQAPILSQIITPTYVRCVSTSTESSAKEQASKPPHLSPSKETVVTLYTKKECSLCVPVKEAIQAALKATDKVCSWSMEFISSAFMDAHHCEYFTWFPWPISLLLPPLILLYASICTFVHLASFPL